MKLTSKWLLLPMLVLVSVSLLIVGCSTNSTPVTNPATTVPTTSPQATSPAPSSPAAQTNLSGAGATFPQPLYTKWFDVYFQQFGVKINYQGVGSGTGIQQITAGTVDFGASDAIMTKDQETAAVAAHGPILHIPMTSGATAVIFNIAGITSGQLKLTGDVLANIYLKKITKWNDPAITALNTGLNLPNAPIAVVHRADGSGTTFIFTDYLSKVSTTWLSGPGVGTAVNWPGDLGGTGSAGVAGQVQQVPNSIGYVELAYAVQNKLPWAAIKNVGGNYKEPSLAGTTAAATGIALPDDMKVMITNSTNPDAYPISGFTWILAYVNQTDKVKGQTLVKMLWWALHDGQQYAADLQYAKLSADAVTKAEKEIRSINFQNQPLMTP